MRNKEIKERNRIDDCVYRNEKISKAEECLRHETIDWKEYSRRVAISKTMKGRKRTKIDRKKISDAMKGVVKTEDHKRKISESLKGNRNAKSK